MVVHATNLNKTYGVENVKALLLIMNSQGPEAVVSHLYTMQYILVYCTVYHAVALHMPSRSTL